MKKLFFVYMSFYCSTYIFSQSLSPERISKIKSCTVRITIEGTSAMGTGFFVNPQGSVLTCWHVIEPAIIRDTLKQIIGIKKVYITLNTGEKVEVGFSSYFFQKGYPEAIGYDFCLLNQLTPRKTLYLNFGNFDDVLEGEEIYTCGYPVGIEQPFISKGMVSTKFVDSLNSLISAGKIIKMPRSEALLDITLNGGNSGGAIVRIGSTIEDDKVIGIADFIVNPIGDQKANNLIDLFSKGIGKYNLEGIDPNKTFIYFTQILSSLSLGVSGCISTNHFLNALNNIKN